MQCTCADSSIHEGACVLILIFIFIFVLFGQPLPPLPPVCLDGPHQRIGSLKCSFGTCQVSTATHCQHTLDPIRRVLEGTGNGGICGVQRGQ